VLQVVRHGSAVALTGKILCIHRRRHGLCQIWVRVLLWPIAVVMSMVMTLLPVAMLVVLFVREQLLPALDDILRKVPDVVHKPTQVPRKFAPGVVLPPAWTFILTRCLCMSFLLHL